MATITDWRNLATALNNIKANRNSTPGRASTTIANANTTSGEPLTIIASMDSLANNIDANDKTKFGFSSYNSSISTDNYYSSMDIKLNLLQKKIVTGTYCSANTTCNPNTITSCNPNTYSRKTSCGYSCGCQSQCGHSCCDGVCSDSGDGCVGGYSCSDSCCNGDCSDSCCDGDCSCDSVCTFTSCSHCNPYSGCSHTCSCFNVCTCVFV